MSAAVFVVGLAAASAQTAPGGVGQERNQTPSGSHHVRNQPHGQSHRVPAASFGAVTKDFDNRARSQRGTAARGSEPASAVLRGRSDQLSPAKHNDASVLPPSGASGRGERQRRDSMASDRSVLGRTITQGRPMSERIPVAQGEHEIDHRGGLDHTTRQRHGQTASKGHGPQDVARTAMPRHLPDQGIGNASEREPDQQARGQAGERELGQGQAAGNANHQVRNHRREQARGQARNHAHDQASRRQDEIRKVQAALNQQGFNVGDPDGKIGKRTKEALIAFQKQRGFKTTGHADHETLDALLASGAAPTAGPGNNQSNPTQAGPEQAAPQALPLGTPAEPSTTGQGNAQPAMPPTEPAPENPQVPDDGASGRVPAGSPQENYKDDTVPGGDQR